MFRLPERARRAGLVLPLFFLAVAAMAIGPVLGGEAAPLKGAVATLKGHTEAVSSVAFSPDGKRLITGSFDHTLKLWDVASGKEIKTFGGPQGPKNMVLSVAFRPDGKSVASGGSDNSAYLWQVPSGTRLQAFTHAAAATALAMPPRNAMAYLSSANGELRAWGRTAETPTKSFGHPNLVDAVAFDPAGTRLATGCHDGKVRIFDVAKGALLKEINAHPTKDATMVYALAWSPDGKQIVSAGFDNSLRLWDAAKGAMIREFKAYKLKDFEKGHKDSVLSVAFSPDGQSLASGSGGLERVIKIWKVADGSVVRDLDNPKVKHPQKSAQSHPGWVNSLHFTRDGKRLASAGDARLNKGYLAIWDVASGKLLSGEEMPLGTIYSMALAPDGTLLALGAGARGRTTANLNQAYLLRITGQGK